MAKPSANPVRLLGTITAGQYLSAPADTQAIWAEGIKRLTGRQRGIQQTIRNAPAADTLESTFGKKWPKEIRDLETCGNVANCRDYCLEPEFARLAALPVDAVRAAMAKSGPGAVRGRTLVTNMLWALQAQSSGGASHAPPPVLQKDAVINGRYVVQKCLGRGGFGAAWLVRDKREKDREYVLKFANTDEDVAYLEQELVLAKSLRHENICAYYIIDDDHITKQPFIVMEYGGISIANGLDGRIRNYSPEELTRAVRLVVEHGAAALDLIHRKDLIHGDINPGNIVAHKSKVRICDFGLAVSGRRRPAEEAGPLTLVGTTIGGHQVYSAPEVVLGSDVRSRSDQYSLALVAYSMLQRAVLHQRLAPGKVDFAELSAAQNEALNRALDQDPARRFPTCGEFAQAFLANPV